MKLKRRGTQWLSQLDPGHVVGVSDRDDLIAEAFGRINADPTKYINKVYGQHEVGGTSILYVSSIPFEQLGFKTQLETTPLPSLTWNALSKVPGVVTVGGVLLAGIWWITNRRIEVQRYEEELKRMDDRSNGPDQHLN